MTKDEKVSQSEVTEQKQEDKKQEDKPKEKEYKNIIVKGKDGVIRKVNAKSSKSLDEHRPDNTGKYHTEEEKAKMSIKARSRLTPEVKAFIRDELTAPGKTGSNYIQNFIKNFLREAKDDPNSRCGMLLASSMFSQELLSKLDSEAEAAMAKDAEFSIYRLRNTLYDKQQLIFDNVHDKMIMCITGRRFGKTNLMARMLVRDILKPSHHALYINRSFDNAIAQMWRHVIDLLDMVGIKYDGSRGNGIITLSNGSDLTFSGANNTVDVDKFRGTKLSFVGIDEFGHLKGTRYLLNEVIQPATIDYADSQIVMIGTPPRTKNYAYQLWHNPKIKKYSGTFQDNPYIPNRDKVLQEVADLHGCDITSSFIRREYLGDTEAFDDEALIFKGYKTYKEIPNRNRSWTHAYIGVDWGFEDQAYVVATLADQRTKELYVVEEWHMSKQATSTICDEVKRQYNMLKEEFNISHMPMVICDTNDKSGTLELFNTYKIPNVCNAYKYDKDLAIEQMAEWLRTGNMSIKEGMYLEEECNMTLWKRDPDTDKLLHTIDDEAYHPNGLFALLYVSRQYDFEIMGGKYSKTAREVIEGI